MIAATLNSALLVLPAMSWSGLLNDPKELGAVVLIMVAAAFVGVFVARRVGRDRGPTFFGLLAAMTLVGGLAYMGVEAAGYVLWLLLALAALLGIFALVA